MPAQTPSSSSPRSRSGAARGRLERALAQRIRTGPATPSCSGVPSQNTAWKTASMARKKSGRPSQGCSTTRSMRSEACSDSRSGTTTAERTSASISSSRRWSSASADPHRRLARRAGRVEQLRELRQRLRHARAESRRHRRDGKAEPRREPRRVDLDPEALRLVGHVEQDERGQRQRLHLERERELPVHLRGVEHDARSRRRAPPRGNAARRARRRRSRAGRRGRAGRPAPPCGRPRGRVRSRGRR